MIKSQELADPKSCLNKAGAKEPLFVLRANDESAPGVVRMWARRYRADKGDKITDAQLDKFAEAIAIANAMELWQKENR